MLTSVKTTTRLFGVSLAIALPGLLGGAKQAEAKTPGQTYCFLSVCHRVLTLAETKAAIGKPRSMHASHYDDPSVDRFNPSLITSSGELFRPDAPNNAASPIYPDGTLVAVFAPATKRGAVVRINNAGPYFGNRMIDLSRGLAHKLGITGVGRVVVEVLADPKPKDAVYARGRKYPPVAGFIGKVASVDAVSEHWRASQPGAKVAVAQLVPKVINPKAQVSVATAPDPLLAFGLPSALNVPLLDRHLSVAFNAASDRSGPCGGNEPQRWRGDCPQARPDLMPVTAAFAPVTMTRRFPLVAAREARQQVAFSSYPKLASAVPLELTARPDRRARSN